MASGVDQFSGCCYKKNHIKPLILGQKKARLISGRMQQVEVELQKSREHDEQSDLSCDQSNHSVILTTVNTLVLHRCASSEHLRILSI